LERRKTDAETEKRKSNVAQPLTLEERECFQQKPASNDWSVAGGRA